MRPWLFALSILLAVPLAGRALAQSVPAQTTTSPKKAGEKAKTPPPATAADCRGTPTQIKACGAVWLKDCVKDWDAATHMTKQDYTRVCQRVVNERMKALIQTRQPTPVKATPAKAKAK